MTPAEILRAAAARVREVAQAATPGPWRAFAAGLGVMVEQAGVRDDDHLVAELPQCEDHPDAATPDAAHIALFHPGVALAVADWLDAEAHSVDLRVALVAMGWEHFVASTESPALAVARLLLPKEETS